MGPGRVAHFDRLTWWPAACFVVGALHRYWGISGKRVVYPQLFVGDEFIGDREGIEVCLLAGVLCCGAIVARLRGALEAGVVVCVWSCVWYAVC